MAYKYVSQGNSVSTNFNEDWLQYEFALAVKLQKYDEAVDIGQYLVFINPNKDNYWKQLSGVYYGSSANNILGEFTRALAIATLCC